jgi:hypothetical protein
MAAGMDFCKKVTPAFPEEPVDGVGNIGFVIIFMLANQIEKILNI